MNLSLSSLYFPRWRYALAALALLLIGGYLLFGRSADLGATMTISRADFSEEVSVSGTVTAAQDVDLGFATNGRIVRTYARVGQYVRAGAILAETENGDLIATLAQEQADLAALQAGTRPEELEVAATTVTNAKAALVNAIQNAYTTSDDAVRNRVDQLFSNPRVNPELSIKSPFGLNFEKLKPVPAPVLWIKAVSCNVLNIELMSSSIGSTKQAANCCNFLPALNKVGEFGKKSNEPIKL